MAAVPDLSDAVPLLDYESIVFAIAEVSDGNVTVTVDELKKLKPQKAIAIYKALLFAYCDYASEELSQALYKGSEFFRYPRLYEEITGLCNLAIALDKAMKSFFVNDFSMKDLLAPKPKRTLKLLSTFINRIQFGATKLDVILNAFEESEELKRQNVELEEKRESLHERIAEMKKKKAEDQIMLAQLTPDEGVYRNQYNRKLNQVEGEKKKMSDLARTVEEKGRILDMMKVEDELDECGAVTIVKSCSLNRLSFKERRLCDLEEDAKTALKLITNLVSVLKKHTTTIKTLEDVKDRVGAQEQNFKNLVAIFQNMKRQEHSKHEKLSRINVQHQKRLSSTMEAIELEKKKRSAMKSDVIMKIRSRLEEIETEEREMSALLDEEKLAFENKMKKAADVYGQILDQLDIFHHSLTKGWEMTTPFFAEGRTD